MASSLGLHGTGGTTGSDGNAGDRKATRVARDLGLEVSISLDNFEDPKVQNSKYVLTSPRSLEACARNGIKPVDLLSKPFAYFRDKYSHLGYSDDAIRKLCHDAEHRRLRRLLTAKRDRARMILDETGDGAKLERCEDALTDFEGSRSGYAFKPLESGSKTQRSASQSPPRSRSRSPLGAESGGRTSPQQSPALLSRPQSAGRVQRQRTASRDSLPSRPQSRTSDDGGERKHIPRRPASAEPTARPQSARRTHMRFGSGDYRIHETLSQLDIRDRMTGKPVVVPAVLSTEEVERLARLQEHWETELRKQHEESERARELQKELLRQQVLREHREQIETERRREEMQREWERKILLVDSLRDAERQKIALNSEFETLKRRAAAERIQRLEEEAEALRTRIAQEIEADSQRWRLRDERIRNEQSRVAEFNRTERAMYEERRRRLEVEEREARNVLDAAIRERDATISERAELQRAERLQSIRLSREREEEKVQRQKEAVSRMDAAMDEWTEAVQRRRAEAERWAEAVQKGLLSQRQTEVREALLEEERRHRERYQRVQEMEAQQLADQKNSIAFKDAFAAINASYRDKFNRQRKMYALEGQRIRESFREQKPRIVAEISGSGEAAVEAALSGGRTVQLPFVMN